MDGEAHKRGLAGRTAARTPRQRAAASAANAIGVLVLAEALTALVGPAAGATADALVVAYLLNRGAALDRSAPRASGVRREQYDPADLLAVIALAALVRLVGLATPFDLLSTKVWYAAISTPVLAGVLATALVLEPAWLRSRRRPAWALDALVLLGAVAAGAAGIALLPRTGADAGLGWPELGAAALAVAVASLAIDRLVFGDGLRRAAHSAFASPRWPLGAALAVIAALAMPSPAVALFLAASAVLLALAANRGASLFSLVGAQAVIVVMTALGAGAL